MVPNTLDEFRSTLLDMYKGDGHTCLVMRVPNSLIREAIDEIHARAAYHELFGDKLGIPDPCQKIIGQYFVQNLEDRIDLDFVEVQEGT